jgi:hypothetical protein
MSDRVVTRPRPTSVLSKKAAHRTALRTPNSGGPVEAAGLWPEVTPNDHIPDVPFPIDDDFSTIGNWYLAESTNVQASDPRAEVHRLWGLALWDMAKSDATLFGCVVLLTLHKRWSIASRFDKVLYLDRKQHVYENLCKSVASSGGNVAGNMALAIALLAFAEVREGNFADGQRHINAIAAMDCVCQLDEELIKLDTDCFSGKHDPAILWALSTFATHSMDGGFQHSQYFIETLAAIVDMKRLPSKCAFERMLRAWPWTNTWHPTRVPSLWAEVLIVRGRRWRCITTEESQQACAKKKSG